MVKANIVYQPNQVILDFNGHADYADYGHDIVCSGITTAVFTTVGLLEKLAQIDKINCSEKDGYIHLEVNQRSELIDTIIQNLIEVLENIERQYPENLKLEIANKE